MGLLRTSWVLARRSECCGVRGRGAQLRERRVRGSGLFVFPPSDQVTLAAVVQSPPETSDQAEAPESTLRPTSESVSLSLSGCPSTYSHLCPRASLIYPGSATAPLSSLLVQLPNRKSERVTRAPRAHAQSQLRDSYSRGAWVGESGWARPARRTSGSRRADPFPASRPFFPRHSSRPVDSGGTIGPRGLCACQVGIIGFRDHLEGGWKKERHIKGLGVLRGNDPRTALGSERVPRVHFHLEQAEWPSGVTGFPISPSQ